MTIQYNKLLSLTYVWVYIYINIRYIIYIYIYIPFRVNKVTCGMYDGCSYRFCDTGWWSPAMAVPLVSSGPAKCEALLHGYGTSLLEGGVVPTCDSTHPWWLYSAALLEHQAISTMTCYPTQLHYPDTVNQSLPYPNNAMCQAKKRQLSILKSLVWLDQDATVRFPDLSKREAGALIHSATPTGSPVAITVPLIHP